jgi:hypothetical protein
MPDPKRNASADKRRHLKNVQASDARDRDTSLVRIAIWVPLDQADALKRTAKRAADHRLNPISTDRTLANIPSHGAIRNQTKTGVRKACHCDTCAFE